MGIDAFVILKGQGSLLLLSSYFDVCIFLGKSLFDTIFMYYIK